MSRPVRVLFLSVVAVAVAALASACGTEKISVPRSDVAFRGAVLFSQRCSGCHTLSYAATHGSATNVRTAMANNGPNFNTRCERPLTRVLYAIENGGFSGAIMPQNIVVGQEATAVARFVSKYAGREAPKLVGQSPCSSQSVGTLPPISQTGATAGGATGNGSAGGATTNSGSGTTAKKTQPARGAKQRQPARR